MTDKKKVRVMAWIVGIMIALGVGLCLLFQSEIKEKINSEVGKVTEPADKPETPTEGETTTEQAVAQAVSAMPIYA